MNNNQYIKFKLEPRMFCKLMFDVGDLEDVCQLTVVLKIYALRQNASLGK